MWQLFNGDERGQSLCPTTSVWHQVDLVAARRISRELGPAPYTILMAIASYADPEGVAFPSLATLADETCLTEETVAKHIRTLCETDINGQRLLMRWRERQPDGSLSSYFYRLLPSEAELVLVNKPTRKNSGDPPQLVNKPTRENSTLTRYDLRTNKNNDVVAGDTTAEMVQPALFGKGSRPRPAVKEKAKKVDIKTADPRTLTAHQRYIRAYRIAVEDERGLYSNLRGAKAILDELEAIAATPKEVHDATLEAIDEVGWTKGAFYFDRIPGAVATHRARKKGAGSNTTADGYDWSKARFLT
jgi:hypothetical protein